jgi:hypothetical protein
MAVFTGSATTSPPALTQRRASKSIKPGSAADRRPRPRGRRDQDRDNRGREARIENPEVRDEDRAAGPGGRGGMRSQDYSSPVLVNGKICFVSRSGEAFVYRTGPEFKLLGQNRFAADGGDFSSTPAVSDGQLFIRSSKYLYCVADSARRQGAPRN